MGPGISYDVSPEGGVTDIEYRRFRFDPTINLGHLVSAGVFLISAGIAYATIDLRLAVNERESQRIERESKDTVARVERQADEARARLERRFDDDQRRDREAFAEIKVLLRDIVAKLDLKQDKPGR